MKIIKILLYAVLFLIFVLSVIKISNNNLPEESDKVVHFIMYFFCAAALWLLDVKNYVVFAIGYGILIELIQYFIPWRSFSIGDIVADSFGALSFYLFVKFCWRRIKSR